MKPKIAWVVPYLPAPATSGGAIRILQLARAASEQFELHLFCRGELWERGRLNDPHLRCFSSVWMGRDYWPKNAPRLPLKVRRGSPARLYARIKALHRQSPFAGLVLEHCWGAHGAFDLGIPTLLDEHNVESRYLASWFAARGEHGRDVDEEVEAMRRWERDAWPQATMVTCVSEYDAEDIARVRHDPAHLVPNGTTISLGAVNPPTRRNGRVLFVGAMHHPPNRDAALRLVKQVMPMVWLELPHAQVDIVGPNPPAELLEERSPLVRIHGAVPKVAPFLAQAAVFACPLEAGAGTSLKTIEALAAGVPLVSTYVGARGFGLESGVHYHHADTPAAMAHAIVEVLQHPAKSETMCAVGRALAETFDWRIVGRRYRELIWEPIK